LVGVEAARTANGYEIHWAMAEEGFEFLIGGSAVFPAEARDFFGVGAMDSD
jgi:hypothetical protein